MRNSILKKALTVGVGLSLLACTDLEENLYSDVTKDNFFQTEAEFIAGMGAAYSSLGFVGNHGGLWSTNEISSDELVIPQRGGDWYDGGVLLQLHDHSFQPDNSFFNGSWQNCYQGISTCNQLIETFEVSTSDLAPAFIAELRGLRALFYYWLIDGFGKAPLVTTFATADGTPSSNSRLELYNFVESELNAIIPLLDETSGGAAYGRFNKWTALALQTKLYLNAGVYTGTPQWAKAAAAANEIINSGKFDLEGDYFANFAVNNGGSRENIFVYPYDKVFAGGFNWDMMTLHYVSQDTYNFTAQPWNGYAAIEDFYNSYWDPATNPGPQGPVIKNLGETGTGTQDARLGNFIVGKQYKSDGTPTSDGSAEANDPDGAVVVFTPHINQIKPNAWRQGGARIGKYEYEKGGTENMSNDWVIFRYSDILLSRAEALWRQNAGSTEALTLVNMVRQRAGVSDFAVLTADNLLAERGREMFAEMMRRQDLIRFGKFESPWWEKTDSDPNKRLFPVPTQQRNSNPNLSQNPGYPGGTGG